MKDIKELRKICNIKQKELADIIGLQRSNYANIENGKLIVKNIYDIKAKCYEILRPKINLIITQKQKELYDLIDFRFKVFDSLNNNK